MTVLPKSGRLDNFLQGTTDLLVVTAVLVLVLGLVEPVVAAASFFLAADLTFTVVEALLVVVLVFPTLWSLAGDVEQIKSGLVSLPDLLLSFLLLLSLLVSGVAIIYSPVTRWVLLAPVAHVTFFVLALYGQTNHHRAWSWWYDEGTQRWWRGSGTDD
jgi:hypothetical protein